MAITLEQAKATMTDKVDQLVIDEFRRASSLLDKLTFDDAVSPGTGGSTLTYGYVRLQTPSTASTRKINSEYTANEAIRRKCTADIKIFGGAFAVDRAIQETSGSLNEIEFQLREMIKAARNYFHYLVINGDSAANEDEFDGLDAILTGSSTEYKDGNAGRGKEGTARGGLRGRNWFERMKAACLKAILDGARKISGARRR